VGQYQRQRVRLGRANVQEVDVLPVDLGGELRVLVQLTLVDAPVVAITPVLGQPLEVAHRHPAAPADIGQVRGPSGPGEPDWRTYRVERLGPRTPTGPRFAPRIPPDPDISGYTSRAISTSAYRYQARFTLHVSAETAAERIAPTTGALEPIDEHSCTLRTGSNSLDELAIYVTTKGFDFQVHEPPELVEHVRTLAVRLASAAELPTPRSP
jgi:hypothetical protein